MWKIDYYTLAICEDGAIGNVKQYEDTWYTECEVGEVSIKLQEIVDLIKGNGKYRPVITCYKQIKGHGDTKLYK